MGSRPPLRASARCRHLRTDHATLGRARRDELSRRIERSGFLRRLVQRRRAGRWFAGLGYRMHRGRDSRFDSAVGVDLEWPLNPYVNARFRRYFYRPNNVLRRYAARRLGEGRRLRFHAVARCRQGARTRLPAALGQLGGHDGRNRGVRWRTRLALYQAIDYRRAMRTTCASAEKPTALSLTCTDSVLRIAAPCGATGFSWSLAAGCSGPTDRSRPIAATAVSTHGSASRSCSARPMIVSSGARNAGRRPKKNKTGRSRSWLIDCQRTTGHAPSRNFFLLRGKRNCRSNMSSRTCPIPASPLGRRRMPTLLAGWFSALDYMQRDPK